MGLLIKKARNKFKFDDELVALARSVTKVTKKKYLKDKESTKGTKIKREAKEDGGVQKPSLNFHAGLSGHISGGGGGVHTLKQSL